MSLLDMLALSVIFCLMEARSCYKRGKIWDAISEVEARKQSLPGKPHILGVIE